MNNAEINELLEHRKIRNNKTDFISKYNHVFIYGAGSCGRDVFDFCCRMDIPVECFLDQKSDRIREYMGIPVKKANDVSIPLTQKNTSLTVVAVFNPASDILQIVSNLKSLGYRNIISFVDLYLVYPEFFGDRLWLTSPDNYENFTDEIIEASRLWQDDLSKDLFKALIKFRLTGDYSILPSPQIANQYFPDGIPGWEYPRRFIDCGAYTGDTLAEIYARYGQIEAIAAFEPDTDTYIRLCHECHKPDRALAKELYIFPCGLWSSAEQLKFMSGQGDGSNISQDGDTIIQCVSLDQALHGFRPTFIKMDIEGAEYEALKGAKDMICNEHPQLAICLYHKPDDLWRIPLLLKEWNTGYKFYLRLYKYSCFELVLYAL